MKIRVKTKKIMLKINAYICCVYCVTGKYRENGGCLVYVCDTHQSVLTVQRKN